MPPQNMSKKARSQGLQNQYQGGGPKKQGVPTSVGHEVPYLQYIRRRAGFDPRKPYVFAIYGSTVKGRVGKPAGLLL